ncbi:MAG: hypothetical protein RLZ12_912, partial [Bacillota bacterium]
ELKNLIANIDLTLHEQCVTDLNYSPVDVFGYQADKERLSIQVLKIRQGRIVDRASHLFPYFDNVEEHLLGFILQLYSYADQQPTELWLPRELDEKLLQILLPKIKIKKPQRGTKAHLIQMATKNASYQLKVQPQADMQSTGIQELAQILQINGLDRIEAFDNSHLQGSFATSVMVVFIAGKPAKQEYRKYNLQTATNNDPQAIREVIRRRYRKVLLENLPMADLLLVDGGIAQINAAREVLEDEFGLYLPILGMTKDRKHRTAKLLFGSPPSALPLNQGSAAFRFIEFIQHEVHRFVLKFHQTKRSKEMLITPLDNITGVGPSTRKKLYHYFQSINKMKKGTLLEYKKAGIGPKLAAKIINQLKIF